MELGVPLQSGYSQIFSGPVCMSDTITDAGLFDGTEDASVALSSFFDKIFKKCAAERPSHLKDLTSLT